MKKFIETFTGVFYYDKEEELQKLTNKKKRKSRIDDNIILDPIPKKIKN